MISTIALATLTATIVVRMFMAVEKEDYRKMFTCGFEFALLLLALVNI
jgi:hypothetical protein